MERLTFILDVDGVMTDGKFIYTENGKWGKSFGADDADALTLLKNYLDIRFITGDMKGFEISKKRISVDMGYPLELVSTFNRVNWIGQQNNLDEVIYMGDGIFDHLVMRKVLYGIAPSNGDDNAKKFAKYVTRRSGGDRAVAEACLHILEKFFKKTDPYQLPENLQMTKSESVQ